jgi:hypothetical protein
MTMSNTDDFKARQQRIIDEYEIQYKKWAQELSHILDSMTERQKDRYWRAYSQNEAWDGEVELQLSAARRIKRSKA